MAVLHIVNQNATATLSQCLLRMAGMDSLLLIEDGVYAVCKGCNSALLLADRPTYVLEADLTARGLTREQCLTNIVLVDYNGFVALTVDHAQVLSWN